MPKDNKNLHDRCHGGKNQENETNKETPNLLPQ